MDDIIYDGCNWWWCNSEPMLSEACPLQKHSSHYNKIKGNLEEVRIPPCGFKNVLKPEKMNCGIVFSIPPRCFGTLVLPLHFQIYGRSSESIVGKSGIIPMGVHDINFLFLYRWCMVVWHRCLYIMHIPVNNYSLFSLVPCPVTWKLRE